MADESKSVIKAITEAASPVVGQEDYGPLVEQMGDCSLVLIGEATHGTREFYEHRAEITKALIERKGFRGVAVEADWPDAYRINRYVTGQTPQHEDSGEALEVFRRFPAWMWRNRPVKQFLDWLRRHNASLGGAEPRVGFYGIDLYSLMSSRDAVLQYLDRIDPAAAKRARYRYSCFDHLGESNEALGYVPGFDLKESCEEEVVSQLVELQRKAIEYAQRNGRGAEDEYFQVVQNPRLIKNAEKYHRAMFSSRISSWNVRDRHMADTIAHLPEHLGRDADQPAKLVVWAHNSHLGDASATEMGQQGEINVGQLVREKYPEDSFLLGFTSYTGTVTAASEWGGVAESKTLVPALSNSYEDLFHQSGISAFFIPLWDYRAAIGELKQARLQRAVGVVYRPESERISHYFYARLSDQFDAVIHLDRTNAVEPLERVSQPDRDSMETYPSAL
jgi:erythromycin esterase-like protein